MKVQQVSVDDIKGMKEGQVFNLDLPNYLSCCSVKSTLQYAKRSYPRADGLVYYCLINGNHIELGLVKPAERDRAVKERRRRIYEARTGKNNNR